VRLIISLACLLLLAGCGSQDPPKPKSTLLAEREQDAQDEAGKPEHRAEARHVAAEFVHERLPKWTLRGLHSEQYANGVYRVSADITLGPRSEMLQLEVQQYFPEEGEPYWKAGLLTETVKDALHDSADYEVLKKLNEATSEPEPDDDQP
jgi:hypothetical protein